MKPRELPVFPLGSVLLPGQLLSLHVFEPRYRVMMFDLRDADPAEFVVVLIERGHEVGGGEVRSSVGCVARMVDSDELPDGRHLVVSVGTERVAIDEWLEDDPYPRARVTPLLDTPGPPRRDGQPPDPARTDPADLAARAREVGALAAELGAPAWPAGLELSTDLAPLVWELAVLSPLATIDRQRLLASTDVLHRAALLADLLDEQDELLRARRLWGGTEPG